jgi:hypothetical protein
MVGTGSISRRAQRISSHQGHLWRPNVFYNYRIQDQMVFAIAITAMQVEELFEEKERAAAAFSGDKLKWPHSKAKNLIQLKEIDDFLDPTSFKFELEFRDELVYL